MTHTICPECYGEVFKPKTQGSGLNLLKFLKNVLADKRGPQNHLIKKGG